MIDVLVRHGGDVNKPDGQGTTPLAVAAACGHAACGHAACVRALIEHAADCDTLSTDRTASALMGATLGGHTVVVALLVDANADVNLEHASVKVSAKDVVCARARADRIPRRSCASTRAVNIAVYLQHTEIVELLARHGADVNVVGLYDGVEMPLLHTAVEHVDPELVRRLCAAGADVCAHNAKRDRVLWCAGHTHYSHGISADSVAVTCFQCAKPYLILNTPLFFGKDRFIQTPI